MRCHILLHIVSLILRACVFGEISLYCAYDITIIIPTVIMLSMLTHIHAIIFISKYPYHCYHVHVTSCHHDYDIVFMSPFPGHHVRVIVFPCQHCPLMATINGHHQWRLLRPPCCLNLLARPICRVQRWTTHMSVTKVSNALSATS